jgi:WXXGXW repeat (2 copies)
MARTTRTLRFPILAATALAGLLAASEARSLPVYVRIAPPAPRAEVRIAAPGPGYVWVGGFHRWDGAAYVWVPGHWVLPPRPRAVWVSGHWRHGRRGWFWVEGHWR